MKHAIRIETWMAYFFSGSLTIFASHLILAYQGSFFTCWLVGWLIDWK